MGGVKVLVSLAVKAPDGPYDPRVAFQDMTDEEAVSNAEHITAAALAAARLIATRRLLAGPATGLPIEAHDAAAVLTARDDSDPRFEALSYFEKPWALLVLRLVALVLSDPGAAVRDARARGATVGDVAATLGITPNGVYKRFGTDVVRRPRS